MAALARVEPVQIAGTYLSTLLHEVKTTGLLSVLGNYGPTMVRWIDGGMPLFTTLHTGSVLPLQTSSTVILFLTYCSREQTRAVLDSERSAGLSVPEDETCGFARTYGSVVPGLSAVTVPIFGVDERLVATMSVLARTQDKNFYSHRKIEKIRLRALEASRAI